MIKMSELIKQQNDMIRKESGMNVKEENLKEARTGRFKLSGASEMHWGTDKIVIMTGKSKIVLNKKELKNMVRGLKMHRLGEEKLNEVDFSKVKLPATVDRFLNKFVQSMKDTKLNRMKRSAILYKVIDAAGMNPQQLMADINKIKREL